jgi:hypothetical protein
LKRIRDDRAIQGGKMSVFDKIVDEKIKDAMKNGEFDDLPGKGKPVNLEDYFKAPAHLRVTYQLLKNYGVSPREVELKNEITELKKQLSLTRSAKEKKRLLRTIHDKSLILNLTLEKNTKY